MNSLQLQLRLVLEVSSRQGGSANQFVTRVSILSLIFKNRSTVSCQAKMRHFNTFKPCPTKPTPSTSIREKPKYYTWLTYTSISIIQSTAPQPAIYQSAATHNTASPQPPSAKHQNMAVPNAILLWNFWIQPSTTSNNQSKTSMPL